MFQMMDCGLLALQPCHGCRLLFLLVFCVGRYEISDPVSEQDADIGFSERGIFDHIVKHSRSNHFRIISDLRSDGCRLQGMDDIWKVNNKGLTLYP